VIHFDDGDVRESVENKVLEPDHNPEPSEQCTPAEASGAPAAAPEPEQEESEQDADNPPPAPGADVPAHVAARYNEHDATKAMKGRAGMHPGPSVTKLKQIEGLRAIWVVSSLAGQAGGPVTLRAVRERMAMWNLHGNESWTVQPPLKQMIRKGNPSGTWRLTTLGLAWCERVFGGVQAPELPQLE